MPFDKSLFSLKYQDLKNDWVTVFVSFDSTVFPNLESMGERSGVAFLEYPEVEDVLSPIRPSGMRMDLQVLEGDDFDVLWTENERQFFVSMSIGPSTNGSLNQRYFNGFIKPDGIFQDWTTDTYTLSIDCVGGLGFLEDLSYVDSSTGLNFSGLRQPILIIADCLKRTGLEHFIHVRAGINYTGGPSDNYILENTYIKVDRYVKGDQDTIMSCKEVLEGVLRVYGLCLVQDLGEWWIFDPETLNKNDTPQSYVTYSQNGIRNVPIEDQVQFKQIGSHINTYGDLNPNVLQSVSSVITSFGGDVDEASLSFKFFHINANQRLESRASLSGVRINYKYGLDESLIDNEFLQHNGSTYSGWTINDASRHDFGPNSFGALIGHDDSVVVMTADAIAIVEGDLIKVGYSVSNTILPAVDRTFAYRIRIGTSHYLNVGVGEWRTTPYTNYNTVLHGFTDSIEGGGANPAPVTGTLFVEIMGFEFVTSTQGSLLVSRISIAPATEESGLAIQGENHTVQLPGGSVAKDPIEVSNGDNPSSLYYGTIYQDDQITPTTTWERLSNPGEDKAILRLLAEKYVRTQQKPSRYFSGDVYNLLGYLSVFTINNIPGFFLPVSYRLDTLNRSASLVLRQYYTDELSGETYELTLDYGNTVKPTVVG